MKPESDYQFTLILAYILAVANALIIGLSFSFVKVAVTLAGPIDTLVFRFVIALAVCVLIARIKGIRPRFGWKNSIRLLPLSLCYPLGFFLFQALGMQYATSGEAGILAATGPIFTAIIAAAFIRERYNVIQSLSILLSVAGVLYIAYQKGDSLDPANIAGIVLILLSALSGAGYAVLNRHLVRSFTTFEITYYLMIVGAVAFTIGSLVQHAVYGTFSTIFAPFSDATFTTAILYLALFSSLLTTVFASLALNRLTSAANVNVLTTGFDAPNVDCVILLRPTASPGLYYQMVGRGFRLHETKSDCLVLDYGGNILRHGPVDAIQVAEKQGRGGGDAPAKECPECLALIHAALRFCPDCGYEFPEPEKEKHDAMASNEGILSGEITDTEYDGRRRGQNGRRFHRGAETEYRTSFRRYRRRVEPVDIRQGPDAAIESAGGTRQRPRLARPGPRHRAESENHLQRRKPRIPAPKVSSQ